MVLFLQGFLISTASYSILKRCGLFFLKGFLMFTRHDFAQKDHRWLAFLAGQLATVHGEVQGHSKQGAEM